MDIIHSNANPDTIYAQIAEQIRSQIVSGVLKEGSLLPSIRVLAKELRISVITTKRAYDELEKEGYIQTIAAKGSYVASRNHEQIKEEYLRKIEEHMRAIMLLADFLDLGEDELGMMYALLKRGDM
ncbi:GntR family transcriptional regulator [Sphaerochaeta sp. S2]|nr:GntR family transcriptional regulator [Sphaerochaeta sp. S2]